MLPANAACDVINTNALTMNFVMISRLVVLKVCVMFRWQQFFSLEPLVTLFMCRFYFYGTDWFVNRTSAETAVVVRCEAVGFDGGFVFPPPQRLLVRWSLHSDVGK